MAQFTVVFSTDSDAFAYDKDGEIVRILHWLAADIAENGSQNIARIRDANGARVGFATTEEVATVL